MAGPTPLPSLPIVPAGLPPVQRARLRRLERTRERLYTFFVVFLVLVLLLFAVAAVVYPADAIEPRWPAWVSGFLVFLLPGLPTNVLDFAAKYPWQVGTVAFAIFVIRRASWLVKVAAQDYAVQAWLRTPTVGQWRLTTPIPSPGPLVAAIEVLTPPKSLTGVATIALLVLVAVNVWSPQKEIVGTSMTASGCAGTRGDCLLRTGESVEFAIRADRPRNRTGVLMQAGQQYEARYLGSAGWRDGRHKPGPAGFEFDRDLLGLRRFWWIDWRRPRPSGRWFEVVGRIGRAPEVFPILDAVDPTRPFAFRAPRDGELVLLVNDVPYENNRGVMRIEIRRR